MQPLLATAAILAVNKFIFGDKHTGKNCGDTIPGHVRRRRCGEIHNRKTTQHGKRIKRVPKTLPLGQAPLAMKPKFVDRHCERLQ